MPNGADFRCYVSADILGSVEHQPCTSDIVGQYSNDKSKNSKPTSLMHTTGQIFGYMSDPKLSYSDLSTYGKKTWFMYRHIKAPNTSLISDYIERAVPIPLSSTVLYTWDFYLEVENHSYPAPPRPSSLSSRPLSSHDNSAHPKGDNHDDS